MTTEHLSASDLLRSNILDQINARLDQRGLRQAELARWFKLTQPRISDLRRGMWDRFSLEALATIAGQLDMSLSLPEHRSGGDAAGISNLAQGMISLSQAKLSDHSRSSWSPDRAGGSGGWMVAESVKIGGGGWNTRPLLVPGVFGNLAEALCAAETLQSGENKRSAELSFGQAHLARPKPDLSIGGYPAFVNHYKKAPLSEDGSPEEIFFAPEPVDDPYRRRFGVVRAELAGRTESGKGLSSARAAADAKWSKSLRGGLARVFGLTGPGAATQSLFVARLYSFGDTTRLWSVSSDLVLNEHSLVVDSGEEHQMFESLVMSWLEERFADESGDDVWFLWWGGSWITVTDEDALASRLLDEHEAVTGEDGISTEKLDRLYVEASVAQLEFSSGAGGPLSPVDRSASKPCG